MSQEVQSAGAWSHAVAFRCVDARMHRSRAARIALGRRSEYIRTRWVGAIVIVEDRGTCCACRGEVQVGEARHSQGSTTGMGTLIPQSLIPPKPYRPKPRLSTLNTLAAPLPPQTPTPTAFAAMLVCAALAAHLGRAWMRPRLYSPTAPCSRLGRSSPFASMRMTRWRRRPALAGIGTARLRQGRELSCSRCFQERRTLCQIDGRSVRPASRW